MNRLLSHIKLSFFFILFCLGASAQFYNGSQMEFGKNRVQWQEVNWTYYDYEKYQIYFYEGGKEVANYVSRSAQKNMEEIEKLFDYQVEGKIQFILYNKQSDFSQTNIGLSTDEQYNIGGVTRIVASKVSLYFEGDHSKIEQQIRAGIAEVLINQMMYGGNAKDMLKNSTLLTLPDWYVQGLISYISTRWNSDIDSRVKDGILSGKFNKFNRLTGVDAVYAGHSIWNYIADTYGESVISNILYMTKVSRNIESAFLFVLGVSLKNLSREWIDAYYVKYQTEAEKNRKLPDKAPVLAKPKVARVYNQLKVSPDGNSVIYVTNEMGQYKIWLYDLRKKKPKRIKKVGHKLDRINDYSYPILTWHPSGKLFSYITERKGEILLTTYSLEERKKETRRIMNFEKILDVAYSQDGRKFAMSAIQGGQSDIFVFTVASNAYEQITKDFYDDLNPRFIHNTREIAWSSNRTDDTIRFENGRVIKDLQVKKDIFVYDYMRRSNVLKRLTNTPNVEESYPADYDSVQIAYLSEANGIKNRYIAHFDSVISYVDTSAHYRYVATAMPITNYPRSISEQDVSVRANKIAEVVYHKGRYRMYLTDLVPYTALKSIDLKNTTFREKVNKDMEKAAAAAAAAQAKKDSLSKAPPVKIINQPAPDLKRDSNAVDINNYTFDTFNGKAKDVNKENEKKPEEQPRPVVAVADSAKKVDAADKEFVLAKQRNYNVYFATDYIVSQLDNSFLNAGYQKFTGGGSPIYLNPGFNGFFKIGLSDLFEDYRIVAGARLSGDLNSNEFFLSHEDRRKNVDKQLVLHRQALLNISGLSSLVKVYTHEAKYALRFPFSEVTSLRPSLNLRNDKTIFLSTDQNNLEKPHDYQYAVSPKLEFVFDNTIKKGLNLYNGTRYKLFAEYYQIWDVKRTNGANGEVLKTTKDHNMVVLGLDIRHYQKVHRDIIWANRLAASTSLGSQKLIYYMGGVDNWLNSPQFDRSTNIDLTQNYAYQTLATNMRGFHQNVRNGNSFAVINSELRVPVFRYLLNRPIKSDFINNFQVIGFGDIGTAWTDKSPYSPKNSLNTFTIYSKPLTITLNTRKEPIVGGYGWGLRSRVLGYFIRVDWAWGIEDLIVLPRVTYVSFSLDF